MVGVEKQAVESRWNIPLRTQQTLIVISRSIYAGMENIQHTGAGAISIAIPQIAPPAPTDCKTTTSPLSSSPSEKYNQLDKLHTRKLSVLSLLPSFNS